MSARAGFDGRSLIRMLENVEAGVIVLKRHEGCIYLNERCSGLVGAASAHLEDNSESRPFDDRSDPAPKSVFRDLMSAADTLFDGVNQSLQFQTTHRPNGGRPARLNVTLVSLRNQQGLVEHVLGLLHEEPPRSKDSLPGSADAQVAADAQSAAPMASSANESNESFEVISASAAMAPILAKMRATIRTDAPVLISGEAGAGKEFIARAIHAGGLRKGGPFVVLNGGTLSPPSLVVEMFGPAAPGGASSGHRQGAYVRARGGTLYLKEVTRWPLDLQARLLDVLQRPFLSASEADALLPARIIASTLMPPSQAMARGLLRQDLFFRLSVISLDIPPLRQRREDLPLLVNQFLNACRRTGPRRIESVAPDAWEAIRAHTWPDNVRELQYAIESAFASGEGTVLRREDLPPNVRGQRATASQSDPMETLRLDPHLEQVERDAILRALVAAGGQRNRAAELMGISRSRLYRRMEALGIDPSLNV